MRNLTLAGLATTLTLLACSGDGSFLDEAGVPLQPARIGGIPEQITLSLVEGTSDTSSFFIENTGGFPLEIASISSREDFLAPLFSGPFRVEKDEVRETFFRAEAASVAESPYEGEIRISSNAENGPTATTSVLLEVTPGPKPEIAVTPDTLWTQILEGQVDTVSFSIQNTGTAELLVNDVSSSASHAVPLLHELTVPPGESKDLEVQVDARDLPAGALESFLQILSNDEDESNVRVELRTTVESAGPFPPTLTAIQTNVFDGSCALGGCHGDPWTPLYLAPGESRAHLVEIPARFVPEMYLVKPFDAENSYLITKLVELDKRRVGRRMPDGKAPYLNEDEIDVIRQWIDNGALDN